MALLEWHSDGWVSHEKLAHIFQLGMLEGPARPQMGPLAFNHLCTPFYTYFKSPYLCATVLWNPVTIDDGELHNGTFKKY